MPTPEPPEAVIEDDLAAFLEAASWFRVLRQVMGRALWSPCPAAGGVRADLLLLASRRGLAAGWTHGPIVIECKRLDQSVGLALAQLLDYRQAAWWLPNGARILAEWGFAYPFARIHGPLASVAAQNRIGTAWLETGELELWCGEQRVLAIGVDRLRIGEIRMGRRHGSRS